MPKWVKALTSDGTALVVPHHSLEDVPIRYDNGKQIELGSAQYIRELYANGWDDMEFLDESEPSFSIEDMKRAYDAGWDNGFQKRFVEFENSGIVNK